MKNVDVGWGPIGLNEIRREHTKLKLNTDKIVLELDQQFKLTIESDYEQIPIWKSSNENVAIVDQEGNVSVIGYGVVYITVTSGKFKGTCMISVPKPVEPEIPDEPITPEPDPTPDPEPDPDPEPEIPESKLDNTKIYYGTIQSPTFTSYSQITEDDIVKAIEKGTLVTANATSMETLINVKNYGDAVVVLIPSGIYSAFKDDGGGTKVKFNETASGQHVHANGEIKLGDFYVYGEMMFLAIGNLKIYVE